MGLFDRLFSKKEAKKAPVKNDEPVDTEKLDKVAEYIKEHYSKPSIHIKAEPAEGLSIFTSKFGGYPYWDLNMDYPCTSKGEKLLLLAQLNFSEADIHNELLPQKGILQFFIAVDDSYGQNLDNNTLQDMFRVVYHENIDETVTLEKIREIGIRSCTELNDRLDPFPLYKEMRLTFTEASDCVSVSLDCFEDVFKDAYLSLFAEIVKDNSFRHLSSKGFDYLADKVNTYGHKILGYPAFTQSDPRYNGKEEIYDTLLLQIDSDFTDIMWGDSGICNFFINSTNLKNLDFSDVMYNWDCY